MLTRESYCTREIKVRVAIAKEAFNRKMSLMTSKLSIKLKKTLIRCYVLIISLHGTETLTLINWSGSI